ncbi:MAG: M20/M25/M40 family metallo-hydrolase [Bacillota bacterium]|nr:M20/M25/M40 family metallo-hydrolase [Bacillota bacterium]
MIESRRGALLAELQALCRQPSIAAQNVGMAETAEMVRRMMEDAGLKAEIVPTGGHPVVYGELDVGAPRTLLFYNHYDVQPPEPLDEWTHPPFGAEIHDGVLYARGVSDNKGNFAARIQAVRLLREAAGGLPVNVKFLVEGEEEIGSGHLGEFIIANRDRLGADGAVWESGYKDAQGRPGLYFGVKGILYVELRVRGANRDLHSAGAAVIENPAWRLVWLLNTLKGPDERVLLDGFYDDVLPPSEEDLVWARGSTPEEEAARLAGLGIKQYLLGLTGLDLAVKSLFQPTCTICGLTAGYQGEGSKTVLPKVASAKLDFRLVPKQDPQRVLASLRDHLRRQGCGDFEVIVHGAEPAGRTSLNAPIAKVLIETAREAYGVEPSVSPTQAGSGPMHWLVDELGIPTGSIGVGWHRANNHAPDESIRVDDYFENMRHVALLLVRFAEV